MELMPYPCLCSTSSDGNLMGNVYFAAFVSMHARIRDAGIAHLLGAGKPGAAGAAAARGHFKFVTCWCNFCGGAFPGDTLTIEVSGAGPHSCKAGRQWPGSACCCKQIHAAVLQIQELLTSAVQPRIGWQ